MHGRSVVLCIFTVKIIDIDRIKKYICVYLVIIPFKNLKVRLFITEQNVILITQIAI